MVYHQYSLGYPDAKAVSTSWTCVSGAAAGSSRERADVTVITFRVRTSGWQALIAVAFANSQLRMDGKSCGVRFHYWYMAHTHINGGRDATRRRSYYDTTASRLGNLLRLRTVPPNALREAPSGVEVDLVRDVHPRSVHRRDLVLWRRA